MGQAKSRGSYEQRKAEGEAKREREEQQRREAAAWLEAQLTPQQRASRARAQRILAIGAGIVASDPYALAVLSAAKTFRR